MPLSTIAQHEAKIAELKIKLAQAKTPGGVYYYTICLKGWETMLSKLKAAQR